MKSDEVEAAIHAGLPGAHAKVTDMTGTGDHFAAVVESPEFAGKSVVQQHRMVYAALGDLMKGPIHALKLETRPPAG
jgi:stress-induced morphogen